MAIVAVEGVLIINKKLFFAAVPLLIILLSWLFIYRAVPFLYSHSSTALLVTAYLLSLSFLAVWIKYQLGSLFCLVLGFAITPLPFLVYEYFAGGWLQYLITAMVALYYSLPMVMITTVILILRKVKRKGDRSV